MKKPVKVRPKRPAPPRKPAPQPAPETVTVKAQAAPPPAKPKKKPRPAQPVKPAHKPHVWTAGPKASAVINAFLWKHGVLMDFGAWSRKRAGMLVLVFLLILALWWQWIAYHVAKPTVMANCENIAYARVVTVDRACRSAEHCTKQQISDAAAAELVFDLVAMECFKPEPWSPHGAVYDASVWLYDQVQPDQIQPQPVEETTDPDAGEPEDVIVADNA